MLFRGMMKQDIHKKLFCRRYEGFGPFQESGGEEDERTASFCEKQRADFKLKTCTNKLIKNVNKK